MYGLFQYTYDYHEWEYLICVSENKKDLLSHLKSLDDIYSMFANNEIDHEKLSDNETSHYMIKEVKVV